MDRTNMIEKPSKFAYGIRSVSILSVTAAAVTLGLLLSGSDYLTQAYFWHNSIDNAARSKVIVAPAVAAAIAAIVAVAILWSSARRNGDVSEHLWRFALTCSPLAPLAFAPVFLNWSVWQDHDLPFLLLVLIEVLALRATVTAAMRAQAIVWFAGLRRKLGDIEVAVRPSSPIVPRAFWISLVLAVTLFYIVWFAYYTTIWHRSGRSGYDLAIEDNILWNIVHGGEFFHAAPTLGPTGSHFCRHATLIAYLLAPFYALHQSAEMVLIIQSVLQGLAAIPLFLFARRRLGDAAASFIAILYLFQPALQESNLFEAHYVKFGPLPFFTTLWLLDSQRSRWAVVAACLTLAVREDVSTWVVLLSLWGIFADRSRRASILITALSCLYVALIKFVAMPAFSGGQDELTFMYRELIPQGKQSFAWALITVIGNPAYFIRSLLDMDKLVYFLQIMVPLAFLPLTRKVGWFALIPGSIFCLMATHYSALVDIHFQYSPHFLAFLFPALVIALQGERPSGSVCKKLTWAPEPILYSRFGGMDSATRGGALCALGLGTLLCTYQYGSMMQQNTSRGGPTNYRFGWDDEGRARHRAIDALREILPPRAKVAASALTITQISSRPDGYSLSLSLYDVDWIMAPTARGEFVADERSRTVEALRSGSFGVVAVVEPFFLAQRGSETTKNSVVLAKIGY